MILTLMNCSLFLFQSISPYSGHYKPTDDSLDTFMSVLKENGVNLDEVEVCQFFYCLATVHSLQMIIDPHIVAAD